MAEATVVKFRTQISYIKS